MSYRQIVFLVLMSFCFEGFAQTSFDQFVKEIESKTKYRFYYRASDVDSLKVNAGQQTESIDLLLKQALAGTNVHYAIDPEGNIFITKDTEVFTGLLFDLAEPVDNTKVRSVVAQMEDLNNKNKVLEDKLIEIGVRTTMTGNATLSGHIRNGSTGENLIGASLIVAKTGVMTDQFGYYTITLPKGKYEIEFKSLGMKTTKRVVMLNANGKLDVELFEEITALKEVVVTSERDQNVQGVQMGREKFDAKLMRQVPVALGEYDVIKVLLTLPGVQTVGEGASGFNVRGGATNQNLILFNDAVIYNPSHLFGFFSAFNPDAVKTVELYKSGIPAEFGGRISSVLEVNSPEGNKKKFSASGGISPVAGRLTLQGPIFKDKTSFLIGARSTYSDWLLKKIPSEPIRKSDASFYDINVGITHEINDNNTLFFTGYLSSDQFKLNSDTIYKYANKTATLKWKHTFNSKLHGVLAGSYSGYNYSIESDAEAISSFRMKYDIQQWQGKADFNYFYSPKNTINFGASAIKYNLNPGSFLPTGSESLIKPDIIDSEQALESAVYIGDTWEVSSRLSLYGGLRYSFYSFLGDKSNATYHGAEPRASARYILSPSSSIKISFNRMRQYIQMLSNTTAISPTDIWKLSDAYIKPQIGNQYAIGYYKNLKNSTIETSAEVYYKTMQNFLDYKSGAILFMNHNIEQDAINARGRAYGIELMVKKLTGKLNGWISYTYSRSLLQAKGEERSETINNGKLYPSNYDKPHALNFIGNYKINRRFSVSLNVVYSTGRPITVPLERYVMNNSPRLYYSNRNEYRIPDYFRTDLSLNVEGNHKIKKLAHSSWTFAIYNLTGRRNAYSVYFQSKNLIRGYQLSVFGNPIPTITYNFKF